MSKGKVSQIHNLSLYSKWMGLQPSPPPMFGNREAYPSGAEAKAPLVGPIIQPAGVCLCALIQP
jgi:hypothetical protein